MDLSSDGEHSVKSEIALLQGYGLQPLTQVSYSWIWSLSIPPKIMSSYGRFVKMISPLKQYLK